MMATCTSIQMNLKNNVEQKKSPKYTYNLILFTEKSKAGNTVFRNTYMCGKTITKNKEL